MPDLAEDDLSDAITAYVRAQNRGDARVVTDYVMVAVSVDLHTADEEATYTIAAPGQMHSGIGLAQYALDVLRSPEDDDA